MNASTNKILKDSSAKTSISKQELKDTDLFQSLYDNKKEIDFANSCLEKLIEVNKFLTDGIKDITEKNVNNFYKQQAIAILVLYLSEISFEIINSFTQGIREIKVDFGINPVND